MSARGGFTLLEILLATSLLAAVTAATFSWVGTQTRAMRAAAQRLRTMTTADALADAIRDDLLQSLPDERGRRFESKDGKLLMTTLNRMPGDAPGTQRVVWRQDTGLDAVVREVIPPVDDEPHRIRAVSHQLRLVRIKRVGASGLLTLICRARDQDHDLSIPVTINGLP